MINSIQDTLCDLGICDLAAIEDFHPKVRDRSDVSVKRCGRSGVIFLSRSDHMDEAYYAGKKATEYWGAESRAQAVEQCRFDDERRSREFADLIKGSKWLDVGAGAGGLLDLLGPVAKEAYAVELQREIREDLQRLGYPVYASLEETPGSDFTVVSLFHVFEHLTRPLDSLEQIRRRLEVGGSVIIEVPHARDFLIDFLDVGAFKDFTFWSEHLILHTRESLRIFLEAAGFRNVRIEGYQRYPLSNHMYWLRNGMPGGHVKWAKLDSEELSKSYSEMLKDIDATDTLIAHARK